MASVARCHWQCCGCKAIFPTEKNAKTHVTFQLKAIGGPGRGPGGPGRRDRHGHGGRGRGRGSAQAGGTPSRSLSGLRRHWPNLNGGPDGGPGPAGGPGPRPQPLYYQMILLDPQGGSARMPAVLVTNDSARDFDDDSEESLRVAVDHRRRGDRDSPADADYESDRPTSRRGRTGPAEQDGYQLNIKMMIGQIQSEKIQVSNIHLFVHFKLRDVHYNINHYCTILLHICNY